MRTANTALLLLLLACMLLGSFACPVRPQEQNGPPQEKFVGSAATKVFHREDCRYCDVIKPENRVEFKSYDEAIKAGYAPCKVCKPGNQVTE